MQMLAMYILNLFLKKLQIILLFEIIEFIRNSSDILLTKAN